MNKTLLVQIFVIASIVAGYFLIDFNKVYNYFKGEVKYTVQDNSCDLHKSACTIVLEDGKEFTLEVFPKEIPLMKNLTFKLKSSEKNLENISLNIYATNMFMGYFDLKFKNLGNGLYEAKGTLPTCPVGNMKWNADISLEKINQRVGARFQFQTTR
ncbi:hypothetical protein [Arcobacter sp. YIC-80]|uniref:hypothetical protein n=1 Tax=unclassified Arcobacter TaxID=2593671 RepID=UPI00384AEB31